MGQSDEFLCCNSFNVSFIHRAIHGFDMENTNHIDIVTHHIFNSHASQRGFKNLAIRGVPCCLLLVMK